MDSSFSVSELEKSRILSFPEPVKALQFSIDCGVLVGAFVFAYLLRFDFAPPMDELQNMFVQILLFIPLQMLALRLFRVHKFIWRYVSWRDALTVGQALLCIALIMFTLRFFHTVVPQSFAVPYSITILCFMLAGVGLVGVRLLRKDLFERTRRVPASKSERKPVILVGAGQAGVMTLNEIKRRPDIDVDVKVFVDDDRSKHGALINGVRVAGGTRDLPRLIREYDIDHVIISIAQADREDFQKILKICRSIPIKVRTIPGLYELLQDKVTVSRIRDVEVEDLLGRTPVKLDQESVSSFLKGKVVMVTGAGGSIGSELVRQLSMLEISRLIMVERSEFALFQIDQAISTSFPDVRIEPVIADICDRERIGAVFARYRPDVVFHAAAHKHVPLMEKNSSEALKNNVAGTRLVGELAGEFGAEAFVLISSDKAVFPKSIMGATKRLAELVIQDLDNEFDTRFMAVRFGNVIGSNGSVIPIFREQIKKGGPVTVTHPRMTRYFMTIPEATQLVLQAGAIGRGGEILILDMGKPIKILDLAEETIRLSGLRPYVDIRIKFVGIRPGEKMHEVLESDAEQLLKTVHPKIFVGKINPYSRESVRAILTAVGELGRSGDEDAIRQFIATTLPDAKLSAGDQTKELYGRNGNSPYADLQPLATQA